jgi:tRNA(Ile)-lysidine synthase
MAGKHNPVSEHEFLAALERVFLHWEPAGPRPSVVAFSGGVDSTVLLAALCRLGRRDSVRAVHVDHGLHGDSARWAEHCAAVAASLDVRLETVRVSVDRGGGRGLEAAAREARYRALGERLASGEVLLTAHHGDDQLETLLLRLLRGSGVRGMRGIIELAEFGAGQLARPLLAFSRAALRAQAEHWGLSWLEDPANANLHHDRNFLRAAVLPKLTERWPAAARMAERMAAQMTDAEQLLVAMAIEDAGTLDIAGGIQRAGVAALSPARQRNVLRFVIRNAGLGAPSAVQLEELRVAWLHARVDAQTLVRWPGGEGRVYRQRLYLLAALPPPPKPGYRATIGKGMVWSGVAGRVALEPVADGPGLPESWIDAGLTLMFRSGGERFQPLGKTHRRPLRNWLQEAGIVPWMRGRIPLLYRGDRLVAVGDLWLAAAVAVEAAGEPRWRVTWTAHDPLF